MYYIDSTLKTAKDFAGSLIHGKWGYVDTFDVTATCRHIHIIECETTVATITVCTVLNVVESFEFTHKEEEQS